MIATATVTVTITVTVTVTVTVTAPLILNVPFVWHIVSSIIY